MILIYCYAALKKAAQHCCERLYYQRKTTRI